MSVLAALGSKKVVGKDRQSPLCARCWRCRCCCDATYLLTYPLFLPAVTRSYDPNGQKCRLQRHDTSDHRTIDLWSRRWSLRRKALAHVVQTNGRSSVCVRTWILRLYDLVNWRSQKPQMYWVALGRRRARPLQYHQSNITAAAAVPNARTENKRR